MKPFPLQKSGLLSKLLSNDKNPYKSANKEKPSILYGSRVSVLVEHRRLELLTPTLPVLCATNCANAPWFGRANINISYRKKFVKRYGGIPCVCRGKIAGGRLPVRECGVQYLWLKPGAWTGQKKSCPLCFPYGIITQYMARPSETDERIMENHAVDEPYTCQCNTHCDTYNTCIAGQINAG